MQGSTNPQMPTASFWLAIYLLFEGECSRSGSYIHAMLHISIIHKSRHTVSTQRHKLTYAHAHPYLHTIHSYAYWYKLYARTTQNSN